MKKYNINVKNNTKHLVHRVFPEYNVGLSDDEVIIRMKAGLNNVEEKSLTRSVWQIIFQNVFTLFNIINFLLAAIIILTGNYKNALFSLIAVINTLIGIIQEIRAKKNIDKLSIITSKKIIVVRNGEERLISKEEIVIDDIIKINSGSQLSVDGKVVNTAYVEIDESLLTGESDSVKKEVGDSVLSGSYVVSGEAHILVTALGSNSYAAKLSKEAKLEKKPTSELTASLRRIIRILSVVIIPIGVILFYTRYMNGHGLNPSILGASAAMIGMIPEGLMLLTSIAFAVGAINLSKNKTLVQTMSSIETLARVDILCLDKTGTITDGSLKVVKLLPFGKYSIEDCKVAIQNLINIIPGENATSTALKKEFGKTPEHWESRSIISFSSKRKWSGASFKDNGTYILGASEIIFENVSDDIKKLEHSYMENGYRILTLAHSPAEIVGNNLPSELEYIALIVIEDNIRSDAKETFEYFRKQDVSLKVISGDNPITASYIAKRAGLIGAEKYIDMSKVNDEDNYNSICSENVVFGRVSPSQKREIVKTLQNLGHVVAMTGDGVNDVLSLKQADCSVTLASGSEAARCVSDFVLVESNFSSMVNVVLEGRRVVNNVERVASLYLIKTIYSIILAVTFIFLPMVYPFSPIQMTPVNALTGGIPSFFLALRPNYKRLKGKFFSNVLNISLPAALTIVLNIMLIQISGSIFKFKPEEISTMSVLLTGVTGFIALYRVSKPLDTSKKIMISVLSISFFIVFILFGDFFSLIKLNNLNLVLSLVFIIISYFIFKFLSISTLKLERWIKKRRNRK